MAIFRFFEEKQLKSASMRGFFLNLRKSGTFFMSPIFPNFLYLKAQKVNQITLKTEFIYVDYTYFPKSQMFAINHEINCLL